MNGTLLGNGIGEPEKPLSASEERTGAGETVLENGETLTKGTESWRLSGKRIG
jgi:hypothetical protein